LSLGLVTATLSPRRWVLVTGTESRTLSHSRRRDRWFERCSRQWPFHRELVIAHGPCQTGAGSSGNCHGQVATGSHTGLVVTTSPNRHRGPCYIVATATFCVQGRAFKGDFVKGHLVKGTLPRRSCHGVLVTGTFVTLSMRTTYSDLVKGTLPRGSCQGGLATRFLSCHGELATLSQGRDRRGVLARRKNLVAGARGRQAIRLAVVAVRPCPWSRKPCCSVLVTGTLSKALLSRGRWGAPRGI